MPLDRLERWEGGSKIAAAELLAATNYPEIVRCDHFPRGLMFFLLHLETRGLPRFTFMSGVMASGTGRFPGPGLRRLQLSRHSHHDQSA
jgi:hypothetical protein